jgi:hypothetical protein
MLATGRVFPLTRHGNFTKEIFKVKQKQLNSRGQFTHGLSDQPNAKTYFTVVEHPNWHEARTNLV